MCVVSHPAMSNSCDPPSTAAHQAPLSMEVATLNNRFSLDMKHSYTRRRCHLGLIAEEVMSIPGFKASKDWLTLLLGANTAGDF